ncbi:hypothetical protein [Mycolicibacterium komossense]|uniref:Histidine kinase n=1 Tax=Mycolicibacterium komossense TaxID=1779 RepID=A0ABT3CGP0_9MYCO|nr:hypothetical protein [Mycolicibacterium komossense]MCV7228604.1 hypothetical protein [Mycolicibacterium komossense]
MGVDRALTNAALFWAAVAPSIQFLLVGANSHDLTRPLAAGVAFAIHAAVWALAALRRVSPPALLATWTLIGVAIAAHATGSTIEILRAALNVGISVSILAGLLLRLQAAVASSLAISLAIATSLYVAVDDLTPYAWSYLVLLPVNCLGTALAAGVAVRELRAVAAEADHRAHARLTADRTLARRQLEAEAGRRRARLLHDTIVNTLGAIATGRIVSADSVVARRCADDIRAVDESRANQHVASASVDDIFAHARAIGVDLTIGNVAGFRRCLADLPGWQRREILSTIRESVTNVAKHAQVAEAAIEYCSATRHVTVTDAGEGMSDIAPLQSAMAVRAEDAGTRTTVASTPGGGTATTIEIPIPRPTTRSDVFQRASFRMAAGIAAVMLTEFGVVMLVTTTLRTGWSVAAFAPPLTVWLIVAIALAVVLRYAGDAAGLPIGAVGGTYVALMGGMVIFGFSHPAQAGCGVHPNLGWGGDAAATICAVLVLLDGRARVVAPALAVIGLGSFIVLYHDAAHCGGSTVALLIADALVVAAFLVLRRQVSRLSDAVATQLDDELHGRAQQDRLLAEIAIRSGSFDSLIDEARALLLRVCTQPELVHDPEIRATAALEECYLRALIGLPYESGEITEAFVEIINAAKRARVSVEVNLEEGVLDAALAQSVSMAVVGIIAACAPDDRVCLGLFRSSGRGELILVAPPNAIAAGQSVIAASPMAGEADVRLTNSDGLVEIRW